ncbi:MAG TPA: hypothetical protein VFP80_16510 [Thermoanaerobaculia bacterium]|nr:hypothetical protein [Thermoanaerobaculia bacterium]
MPSLNETRFRASPFVELKRLADLEAGQREPFLELEDDPEFYGLFVARPPLAMNVKSVTRPVAELFRMLATPSSVDAALLGDAEIVDLVLDGILEVESAGEFLCGADALPVVCPLFGGQRAEGRGQKSPESAFGGQRAEGRGQKSPEGPESFCPLPSALCALPSRLSREALLYAQDLVEQEPRALAMALYFYNRIPLSAFWRTRFATEDAILAQLGVDAARLEREWITAHDSPGWFGWVSRHAARREAGAVTWKLYVSPRPERIRDAFAAVVRTLPLVRAASFKVANTASGMLRPDKLVAYFGLREELNAAAEALGRELAGCEAQGVPFTASLDEGGLLSWGVDPPDDARALRWLGRESWRLWLVQRLGAALAMAKSARSAAAVEPWRFALERARRHGVDVGTWTPSAALWSAR